MLLILTGCGKTKRDHAAPAKSLYTSTLCKLRRQYAEHRLAESIDALEWNATAEPDIRQAQSQTAWRILSAEHGLVDPDQVLDPYETDLADLTKGQRRAWTAKVAGQIVALLGEGEHTVELHAGEHYAKALQVVLFGLGVSVTWWTEGMQIGEQQQAYRSVRDRADAMEAAEARAQAEQDQRAAARRDRKAARGESQFPVERQGVLFA